MRTHSRIPALIVLISLLAAAPPALAQGKSGEKGQKQGETRAGKQPQRGQSAKANRGNDDQGSSVAQGKGQAKQAERGKADQAKGKRADDRADKSDVKPGRFERVFVVNDVKPNLRKFAMSDRAQERIAAGAVSRGVARGLRDDDVVIRQSGDRITLLNRAGVTLIDLDEQRARNLGNWRVRPYDEEVKSGAPSFCRSGEGHPVFGREWCIEKGFGLGDYRDLRWGRTTDVGDIIFRRQADSGTLARAVLIDVLGDVVFNRLGLHALTLGYSDPLTGVWLMEPTGPRVLRLSSGGVPIAEIYDADRDDRADALVVALRAW